MPVRRLLVAATVLALASAPASATTPTPTRARTPVLCVDESPTITALDGTEQPGIFRVRGTGRALACTERGSIAIFGAKALSLQSDCTTASFDAVVDPDRSTFTVCQSGGNCGTGGCIDVVTSGVATATPTRTPTPRPTGPIGTPMPTHTPLPTSTPTPTSCVSDPPLINEIQFDRRDSTIAALRGSGRALLCFRAGELTIFGAQPIDVNIQCDTGRYEVAVKLRPDALNVVTLCQRGALCGTGGCAERTIDLRGTTPSPTPSITPTPCDPRAAVELAFEFTLQPALPRVGDDVVLTAVVRNVSGGLAGIPTYSLLGLAPQLEQVGSPTKTGVALLGTETLVYHLHAVQAGTAQLMELVTYETAVCQINPTFHYDSRMSPSFAVEVASPGGATVLPTTPLPTVLPTTAPPTLGPTATHTATPCINEPPTITAVERTRELGRWTVRGSARALACGVGGNVSLWSARTLAFEPDCASATFTATVEPQYETFTICQSGAPCGTGGCAEVTVDSGLPTPTASFTPTPVTPLPTVAADATVTPTPTAPFTRTPTPTSCVNDGPSITSVESVSTDPLTVTIRGRSPGFFCFRGGTLIIYGATVLSSRVVCDNGTFEAKVHVEPNQRNTVSLCQRSGVCNAGGCTLLDIDRGGVTPTPDDTASCGGDCNRDGMVAVAELVTGVRIGLAAAPLDACMALDANRNDAADIDEIVAAVDHAIAGCP